MIFSFIKGLFSSDSSDSTGGKVLDNIASGVDKLVLTKEEKLDYNKDAMNLWIRMQEALGDENSARAKARRFLAISVFCTFLFTFFLVIIHLLIGFWFNINVTPLIDAILKTAVTFMLGELTLTTFVFYFGKGIVNNLGAKK